MLLLARPHRTVRRSLSTLAEATRSAKPTVVSDKLVCLEHPQQSQHAENQTFRTPKAPTSPGSATSHEGSHRPGGTCTRPGPSAKLSARKGLDGNCSLELCCNPQCHVGLSGTPMPSTSSTWAALASEFLILRLPSEACSYPEASMACLGLWEAR